MKWNKIRVGYCVLSICVVNGFGFVVRRERDTKLSVTYIYMSSSHRNIDKNEILRLKT